MGRTCLVAPVLGEVRKLAYSWVMGKGKAQGCARFSESQTGFFPGNKA